MIKELIQQENFQNLVIDSIILRSEYRQPTEEEVNALSERKIRALDFMAVDPDTRRVQNIFLMNRFIADDEWKTIEHTMDMLQKNHPELVGIIVEEWVNFDIYNQTPKDILLLLAKKKGIMLYKEEHQKLFYEILPTGDRLKNIAQSKRNLNTVIDLIQKDEEVQGYIQSLKEEELSETATLQQLAILLIECEPLNHVAMILVLDEIFNALDLQNQLKMMFYLIKQRINDIAVNDLIGDSDTIFITMGQYNRRYRDEDWYQKLYDEVCKVA